MNKVKRGLVGLSIVFLLTGCAGANAPATDAASPSASASASAEENPYGGFAVANPAANEVILTVKGASKTIDLSITDLKKFETQEITIMEPFVKANQTFVGVPLSELFDAAGIQATDKVSSLALNDYKYDDQASKFTASKGMIAFLRDGSEIPMDQGGPIRIVFPSGTPYFDFLDAWNWSIRTISVVE
jgi:hypothetical protein